MYEVEITPEGLRHLKDLPPIAENPTRLGKPLLGELEWLWSARRGDYRIIYQIIEADKAIIIHRIQHRRDVPTTNDLGVEAPVLT